MKITKLKIEIEYVDDDGQKHHSELINADTEYCYYHAFNDIQPMYDSSCGPIQYHDTGKREIKFEYMLKRLK